VLGYSGARQIPRDVPIHFGVDDMQISETPDDGGHMLMQWLYGQRRRCRAEERWLTRFVIR